MKIEFFQPKSRIQDWVVRLDGRSIGSVWRAGEGRYVANCTRAESATTIEAAFKLARKQARSITAA